MSFDNAIKALSTDALKFVKDDSTIGLGSGRAATAFTLALGAKIRAGGLCVRATPTSLQIRLVAEKVGIPLVDSGELGSIDAAFDGADQIDADGNMIKGGGGALLREKILIGTARKVIIMADKTKFSRKLDLPVPVEVFPTARQYVSAQITKMGASPVMRRDARKYPVFTENGNLILDCDFGKIDSPSILERKLARIAGVAESGLFTKRPSVIYRAGLRGRFDIIG